MEKENSDLIQMIAIIVMVIVLAMVGRGCISDFYEWQGDKETIEIDHVEYK